MHACLNVDEIIRLIAGELVVSKSKTAAVALAFCRRSFEKSVLDVLWETQDKLLPLGNLETVMFNYPRSEQIGDFLEAFERAVLAASIQNILSESHLFAWCSRSPNYSSLLPFTQPADLVIHFSCDGGCPSRVDDEITTTWRVRCQSWKSFN